MTECERLLADLAYLEQAGMTINQVRELHHWSCRPSAVSRVTFDTLRSYFGKDRAMRENNARFAARVALVADMHRGGFSALVQRALAIDPL